METPYVLAAAATQAHAAELALLHILLQLAVIIALARWLGHLAIKLGQPRVVGEILGGLALGPSLLGGLAPGVFDWLFLRGDGAELYYLSQVGLILLMLQIGMEFDFSHLRDGKNRRAVLAVTLGSLLLPLLGGFGLGWLMHPSLAGSVDPYHFSAFVAVALGITALPILGRIMADLQLTRTRLGSVTISAAAFNDVVGWVLLAVVTALASAQFSINQLLVQLGGILLLGALLWFAIRPLLLRLARWSVNEQAELSLDGAAILVAVTFVAGAATIQLGIFAIFGGFAIGVLLYDANALVAAWRRKIEPFVQFFFLPIFFTYTGLRTDVAGLDSLELWGWCLAVIAVASFSKCFGAYASARWAGVSVAESRCIAIMMNTRALMELIVLNVGHDLGIIPSNVFTMLVIMAVVTTVITTPFLRRFLRRCEPTRLSA